MAPAVIQNTVEALAVNPPSTPAAFIQLSDSGSSVFENAAVIDDGDSASSVKKRPNNVPSAAPLKKPKLEDAVLPIGFLDPLTPEIPATTAKIVEATPLSVVPPSVRPSKQFWKAGDYEGQPAVDSSSTLVGVDHVRVHPKFLHSNATSHKWALGALAELLDNSMDEVCHGATYINIDMLMNAKDGTKMLLVEDNGGGMDPDRMRQCMSLGYSEKSKSANTIGQYGNGFKTSSMRLGADVIVFSRYRGKEGRSPTQSIGLLSYTFLQNTGKEDIVVPMIDYVKEGDVWNKLIRASSDVWKHNLETISEWSPYCSEADLLQQFNFMEDQGTRVVIYNLWDDDQGELELDFDTDQHDIQVRGANRDDKKIQMAKQFPNLRHFLTYRHSLRSYTSILYLRIPHGFRMILRGKEIEHHNIVNDMMLKQEVTYRPQPGPDGVPKDPSMVAVVTIGFIKDAKNHVDVQGFNVYHKNRLIKPFWRLWNAAGSDGRGVIGVLEANFVEPAHDKQGFERTTVLLRLEARLVQMQKSYWRGNCHKIGYAPRHTKRLGSGSEDRDSSPEPLFQPRDKSPGISKTNDLTSHGNSSKSSLESSHKLAESSASKILNRAEKCVKNTTFMPQSKSHGRQHATNNLSGKVTKCSPTEKATSDGNATSNLKANIGICNGNGQATENFQHLTYENKSLKNRLKELEEKMVHDLQYERDKNKALSEQVSTLERQLEVANNEQEALINIFQEERSRRDTEEENMRKKLKDASATIHDLVGKLYSEPKSNINHERGKM